MKTEIHITGQIMGNSRLRNAIISHDCEERGGMNVYRSNRSTKEWRNK